MSVIKKDIFFKSGRPTKDEKELISEILDLCNGDENKFAVAKQYGKAVDLDTLREMKQFVTGERDVADLMQAPNAQAKKPIEPPVEEPAPITNTEETTSAANGLGGGNEPAPAKLDDFDDGINIDADFLQKQRSNLEHQRDTRSVEPFDRPVVERDYTKGFSTHTEEGDGATDHTEGQGDADFDKSITDDNKSGHSDAAGAEAAGAEAAGAEAGAGGAPPVEQDIPAEQDIPEPAWAGGGSSQLEDMDMHDLNDDAGSDLDDSGGVGIDGGNDNLKDLTPDQKKKYAEKTAKMLMSVYCKWSPKMPSSLSKISESKLKRLIMEDKIDPNMLLDNDMTIEEFVKHTNAEVDKMFVVDEETKAEIQEPLIEVLLENDFSLTPTQRLFLAIGNHVAGMGMIALKLASDNKKYMDIFEKTHSAQKQAAEPSSSSADDGATYTKPDTTSDIMKDLDQNLEDQKNMEHDGDELPHDVVFEDDELDNSNDGITIEDAVVVEE